MTIELRDYQTDAVRAVYEHIRARDDNPCVVIPTAGGKTPVMAAICRDVVGRWKGRVLILAHVKELLEQAVEKLNVFSPELLLKTGVYSAGLNSRDTDQPVIVAGVQSVYRRACDLGGFQVVIIDEAHMIPPDGDGMYRTFLDEARVVNPHLRVIGLTATPFRMTSGAICAVDNVLNHVCYEIGVKELIARGFLSPLITKAGHKKVDLRGVQIRGGEFVAGEVESAMDTEALVESACAEIVEYTGGRKSVLVFASGVKHAQHVADVLHARSGVEVGVVFGETPSGERDFVLSEFRAGRLKYLVNVNVLTTGFDAPNVDCVVLLRPTLSPGLYYQMVGRGFRIAPGKNECLVLDFGGNVERHGPVDSIEFGPKSRGDGEAPAKECPVCHSVVATGYAKCPDCGHEFPPREQGQHRASASEAGILSGQVTVETCEVLSVEYDVHYKRGAGVHAPRTMRVEYCVGVGSWVTEWVCFEHTGYARAKAERWWAARTSLPCPDSAREAVELANSGALAGTETITVRKVAGEPFERITAYRISRDAVPVGHGIREEDIPF